jgi:hypothetical protein
MMENVAKYLQQMPVSMATSLNIPSPKNHIPLKESSAVKTIRTLAYLNV